MLQVLQQMRSAALRPDAASCGLVLEAAGRDAGTDAGHFVSSLFFESTFLLFFLKRILRDTMSCPIWDKCRRAMVEVAVYLGLSSL